MKKPNSMTMTLILLILGFLFTAAAAIFQYIENNNSSEKLVNLQDKLLKYTAGSDMPPAIVVLPGINSIAFEIISRDSFPLINVKVKCRGVLLPDVGTVYPNVLTQFFEDTISQNVNSIEYDLVIWYNNTKNLNANVFINRRKDGFFESSVDYLDKDTSTNVYKPEMHYSPGQR
jgi:hypothetical protein